MKIMVLSLMITAFFAVCAVLYPIGHRLDLKKRRLQAVCPQKPDFLGEELRRPFTERVLKPFSEKLFSIISRVSRPKTEAKRNQKLLRKLRLAGLDLQPAVFQTIRFSFFAVVMVGMLLLLRTALPLKIKLCTLALGTLIGVQLPFSVLRMRVARRQETIRRDMPDIMDLLMVSVEAGLGFDSAIVRLYEQKKTPLMQELMRSVKDVQMGLSRQSALREMGERNDVQELSTFAGSMIQAEQLGISIRNVLRAQADQLRLARKQRVEAKAMKAPIKMMLPIVVFIFPVMFIVLLAPSVVHFMQNF